MPDSVPFGQSAASSDRRDGPVPTAGLVIVLDVLKVELPFGAVSGSEKIWNHLDEEAIGSDQAALLRRNGFRVGVGQPGSWPPIEAILRASSPATMSRHSTTLRGAYPLSIQTDRAAHDATIFFYRPDGTLVGQSFRQARNILQVDCRVDLDHPDSVILQIRPEVRQQRRGLEWMTTALGLQKLPRYEGRVISELTFGVRIGPGEFLLIGPGRQITQPALIGRQFMSHAGPQRRYETVYILTPRVIKTSISISRG
ncbi:MAG: hypothetical protein ACE5K7_03025 [Phycisphaerae bacterium]